MIQVVVVKWGSRYSSPHVNNTLSEIHRLSSRRMKFICVTDQPEGLANFIETKPFPNWGDWYETLKKGCRLKLSIFEKGILDPDLPTLFFDLDTMILGDVSQLVRDLERTGGMYMCRGHILPLWRILLRQQSDACLLS